MVEYGTGISHGGTSIGNAVNDAAHTFSTMPFAEQALIVIVGLFILYLVGRRAF